MQFPGSTTATNPIFERYAAKTPGSARLYRRAVNVFPGGVTHDTRYLQPHPLYVDRAAGSRKWDVDGNELVDYIGGHGALLLGHNHPQVIEAVREQLAKGTHFGASHELELKLGEQIQNMIPVPARSASPAPAPRARCWPSGWPGRLPASERSCGWRGTFTAGTTRWPSP